MIDLLLSRKSTGHGTSIEGGLFFNFCGALWANPRIDVTIFRQRLFSEDGSEIPDDEILPSALVKLMIVILDFFQSDAEQTQRMISASTNNELIELESLLRKPLNPNVRDENGRTPLHFAAVTGHIESLQLLIEAGA